MANSEFNAIFPEVRVHCHLLARVCARGLINADVAQSILNAMLIDKEKYKELSFKLLDGMIANRMHIKCRLMK
jgi:hypothetical protein